MPKPDQTQHSKDSEIEIDISQLRPGVHVRIPGSWLTHGFMFNSFVITDEVQVRQIASLKLPKLYSDPSRCKVDPLPRQANPVVPVTLLPTNDPATPLVKNSMTKVYQERTNITAILRRRLNTTHRHYAEAVIAVNNAFKFIDSEPKKSMMQVAEVSEKSIAELLADPDSAITLITEKGQYEGQAAHAMSVMTLAQLLGKQAGLTEDALHVIGVGALLHDIGKLTFHSSVLLNTHRNSFEESVYRSHCRVGYDKALLAGGLSSEMLDIILHHHECFDAKGFPDQLKGEKIALATRIVSIANRFDNIINPIDPYHSKLPSQALGVMWSKEKDRFDKTLLQLFIRAMGVYPPGSIVLLSDQRIGVVVASTSVVNSVSPQVLIYERNVPRHEAAILDLTQETLIKIERPLSLKERTEEELEYLLPRRKIRWSFYRKRS
ncbi:MAG: DUF3391 domain-containing protein [Methylovulum sp.]|jgi:HD-GYP domain-containing protein (c-di-GMP phosphodiesterase class II)|nr:DUF3391 domain-containing protein [Methylovulum sp.]MCF7997585.1 DUF3391 domain-containing protein [Methylovulum sp.]